MDADVSAARAALRELVRERLEEGGPAYDGLDSVGPDVIDRLAALGPPEQCAAAIAARAAAGADSVVLVAPPGRDVDVAALGRALLPLAL